MSFLVIETQRSLCTCCFEVGLSPGWWTTSLTCSGKGSCASSCVYSCLAARLYAKAGRWRKGWICILRLGALSTHDWWSWKITQRQRKKSAERSYGHVVLGKRRPCKCMYELCGYVLAYVWGTPWEQCLAGLLLAFVLWYWIQMMHWSTGE